MVRTCCVCKKSTSNFPDLTFHCFPTNEERRTIWYNVLGFSPVKVLPKTPYICSNHFLVSDFHYNHNSGRKFLNANAAPKMQHDVFLGGAAESSDTSEDFCEPSKFDMFQKPGTSEQMKETSKETNISEGTLGDIESLLNEDVPTDFESTHIELNVIDENTDSDILIETSYESPKNIQTNILSAAVTDSSETLAVSSVQEGSIRDTAGPSTHLQGKSHIPKVGQKRKRRYPGDLSSIDFETPRKRRRNIALLKDKIISQRKKIHSMHGTIRYLRSKITNLKSLLKYFKEKCMISESSEFVIKASLDGPPHDIFERMLKGPSSQKYNPTIRSFALTLAFYSPRAYNFIRQTFNKSLPHLSTISKWYESVDGKPGFTKEALEALKLKGKDSENTFPCNLVMDEMSIRKRVEWNGSRFTGYIDIGSQLDSDELPEAREALVFMLVCFNQGWKIPMGYFLTNGTSASEKASLVKKCLEFVNESKVVVTSLTFDGAASNIRMIEHLGADISNFDNLKSHFRHPVTQELVYIFYDPCHMIKLIRNCFASMREIKNSKNEGINPQL